MKNQMAPKKLEVKNFKIDEIHPYENNPRFNKDAVSKVAASIKKFGFKNPILVDKNNVIIAGHTRLEAAKKLKLEEVPCIVAADLTEKQAKALRLADNKVAEFSTWDYLKLDQELAELGDAFDFKDFGFGGATLRLRPFILGLSTPTYTDLIHEAGQRGATALSTEFFCMEQRSNNLKAQRQLFKDICGFDLFAFYKKYSVGCGYLRLNKKIKKPFFDRMKSICDEYNMRFYVSDAHWKDMCHNGSCCGLPEDWNYSRGQFGEALQIAKKNGYVKYSDIREDIDKLLSGFLYKRAESFNTNSCENRAHFEGMTMADYMRWLWNNPQAGQNIYKMFEGVVRPVGKDENGDLIYKYVGK